MHGTLFRSRQTWCSQGPCTLSWLGPARSKAWHANPLVLWSTRLKEIPHLEVMKLLVWRPLNTKRGERQCQVYFVANEVRRTSRPHIFWCRATYCKVMAGSASLHGSHCTSIVQLNKLSNVLIYEDWRIDIRIIASCYICSWKPFAQTILARNTGSWYTTPDLGHLAPRTYPSLQDFLRLSKMYRSGQILKLKRD